MFGDLDESTGQLVFGVENEGVTRSVQNTLSRLGVSTSSYSIQVVEPIRFASLRTDNPTYKVGGLQIHFSLFLCSLGFSADHSGGRSFVTASHCSDTQGKTDGTAYFQPTSSLDPNPIAFEVDDPRYLKGGECSRGKKCRFSDANRSLYEAGVASAGKIAKTSAANNGSLVIAGTFDVTTQDNSTTQANGTVVNKVGRTTGWTQGNVTNSCATINVFGSNIQLFCQTIVSRANTTIIGSGDSGSPAFTIHADGTANLVGIVWGSQGSSSFILSPLSGIVRELGALTATTDGVGAGGVDPPPDEDEPNCPENSNSPKCR